MPVKKILLLSIFVFLLFLSSKQTSFAQQISVGSVNFGQPARVEVLQIPIPTSGSQTYTLAIGDQTGPFNGNDQNDQVDALLTIRVTSGGSSCDVTPTGPMQYLWDIPSSACENDNGSIKFTASIITGLFKSTSSATYAVYATGGTISTKTSFTVNSSLKLGFSPTVGYSNYDLVTTLTGCPGDNAVFEWWKNPMLKDIEAIKACSKETCGKINETDSDSEKDAGIKFTHKYSADNKETKYYFYNTEVTNEAYLGELYSRKYEGSHSSISNFANQF